tara:strand:+ start:3169 stop:4137 length:969 start_codon:yes stop_codon:yes gene_type:complete
MNDLDDIITPTKIWLKENKKIAIATVISTWGSSPRPVGGQMTIDQSGEIIGSVSGGCVENAVIAEAKNAIEKQELIIKDYGISNDLAWETGLACGGELKILIQPLEIQDKILIEVARNLNKRKQVTLITNCKNGVRKIVKHHHPDSKEKSYFDKDKNIFYHAFIPKQRLFIIGAVHIAQSLISMAKICGYEIFLIDPREHFANKKRFPKCNIINDWPDEALKNFDLNTSCHLITLTHDPKIDDPAIIKALESDFGYIGSLGSKKTHNQRIDRLNKIGINKSILSKIHGPVGLDISSKTPEEISISILAELIRFRRQKIYEKV